MDGCGLLIAAVSICSTENILCGETMGVRAWRCQGNGRSQRRRRSPWRQGFTANENTGVIWRAGFLRFPASRMTADRGSAVTSVFYSESIESGRGRCAVHLKIGADAEEVEPRGHPEKEHAREECQHTAHDREPTSAARLREPQTPQAAHQQTAEGDDA